MRNKNQKLKKTGTIRNSVTGYDFTEDAPLSPRKAMRAKCLDCCAGSAHEVKVCPIADCTLWPYRMGKGICTDPTGTVIQMPKPSAAKVEAGRRLGKRRAVAAQN